MALANNAVVEWAQGWKDIQESITMVQRITQGVSSGTQYAETAMRTYGMIYKLCTQKPPHDYSEQLYFKYKDSLDEYLLSVVVPSVRAKNGELLLQELVNSYANYKIFLKWMEFVFGYLGRYFIPRRGPPTLNEIGLSCCFHNLVYKERYVDVRDAVIGLINKEREGAEIDRALLKNVISIIVETQMSTDSYETDLEAHVLKDTDEYYMRKGYCWSMECTYPDYMVKAEECLARERNRASQCLHPSSEHKVVDRVKRQLMVYATQMNKEYVEDLSKKLGASAISEDAAMSMET